MCLFLGWLGGEAMMCVQFDENKFMDGKISLYRCVDNCVKKRTYLIFNTTTLDTFSKINFTGKTFFNFCDYVETISIIVAS